MAGVSGTDAAVSSLGEAVAAARALLAAVDRAEFAMLADAEVGELLVQARRLQSQAEAVQVALVAEAQARELATRACLASGADWVSHLTTDSREVAAGGVWLAEALTTRYHATLDALAAGLLTADQARVIAKAADQIPAHATPDQVAAAENWILGKATGHGNRHGRPMSTKDLRRAARRMCAVVSAELAAEHETRMLNKQSRHAENETWFSLHDRGNGTWTGRFVIPTLHATLLKALLDQLTAPRRWHRDTNHPNDPNDDIGGTGDPNDDTDGTDTDTGGTEGPGRDPTLPGSGEMSWSERLGHGFCELLENLPTGGWSRNGINLIVTTTLDTLRTGLGSATLGTGEPITAGDARRLACQAAILPAILDGDSVPLDLGRTRRLHDTYQRLALSLTHHTCAAAGCTRPLAWCEIHHPHPWATGGTTDLTNALPLCGWHHRRAHDPDWTLHQDHHGTWRFTRNGWALTA